LCALVCCHWWVIRCSKIAVIPCCISTGWSVQPWQPSGLTGRTRLSHSLQHRQQHTHCTTIHQVRYGTRQHTYHDTGDTAHHITPPHTTAHHATHSTSYSQLHILS
jgi:hypothetical protein